MCIQLTIYNLLSLAEPWDNFDGGWFKEEFCRGWKAHARTAREVASRFALAYRPNNWVDKPWTNHSHNGNRATNMYIPIEVLYMRYVVCTCILKMLSAVLKAEESRSQRIQILLLFAAPDNACNPKHLNWVIENVKLVCSLISMLQCSCSTELSILLIVKKLNYPCW